jgi:hypothetical protein
MTVETVIALLAVFVGLCALVVSFCALGVSIWQGIETRKNYRLSVTPNICIIGNWIPDKLNGIIIENRGIGPAIILDFQIQYSGKKYDLLSDPYEFIEDSRSKLLLPKIKGFGFYIFNSGDYLPAGKAIDLLVIKDQNYDEIVSFLDALNGSVVELHYESVYGQSYKSDFVLDIPTFLRNE